MLKKLVTKLWQGKYVSVRDYDLKRAIQKGGLEIEHNGQYMTLSVEECCRLKPKGKYIHSQYKGRYQLVDIEFKPISTNPKQKNLL